MKNDWVVPKNFRADSSVLTSMKSGTNMELIGFASIAMLTFTTAGIIAGRMGWDHLRFMQIMAALLIFQMSNAIVVRMKSSRNNEELAVQLFSGQ